MYLLSILSLTGFTTLLAASHDILNLLTLHLLFGYNVMRAVCVWQIDSLGGLWNLFRGMVTLPSSLLSFRHIPVTVLFC